MELPQYDNRTFDECTSVKMNFKPSCCQKKGNCPYLWSSWMELIEEKYNDESLNAVFKPIENYIGDTEKDNRSLFALCDFICLGCGYNIWNSQCGSSLANEMIYLK